MNLHKKENTSGQVEFEKQHLLNKLQIRDPALKKKLNVIKLLEVHPLFTVIPGDIEEWERS